MLDALTTLVQQVAASEILPRRPSALEAQEFVPPWRAEVVTEADTAAERVLTDQLRALRDVPVVGEEAAKEDASLLALTQAEGTYWLVDPVDGTSAFAAGRAGFGSMVALVERGVTTLAVIHAPVLGYTVTAARGAGAYENGSRLVAAQDAAAALHELGGYLYAGFLDDEAQQRCARVAAALDPRRSPPDYAACVEYPAIARGDKDFVLYGRLRPWDHAPGCLILEELDGVCALTSGERYRPALHSGPLLAARSSAVHQAILAALR